MSDGSSGGEQWFEIEFDEFYANKQHFILMIWFESKRQYHNINIDFSLLCGFFDNWELRAIWFCIFVPLLRLISFDFFLSHNRNRHINLSIRWNEKLNLIFFSSYYFSEKCRKSSQLSWVEPMASHGDFACKVARILERHSWSRRWVEVEKLKISIWSCHMLITPRKLC